MATKAKKTTPKTPKAEVRNLAVYKDDYDFFSGVAEQNDRSRARMFRYLMTQIRESETPVTRANGKASK